MIAVKTDRPKKLTLLAATAEAAGQESEARTHLAVSDRLSAESKSVARPRPQILLAKVEWSRGDAAAAATRLEKLRTAVFANIFGYATEDYVETARVLESAAGLAGYELNVSCPNTKHGGMQFSADPGLLSEVVGAVPWFWTVICRKSVLPGAVCWKRTASG